MHRLALCYYRVSVSSCAYIRIEVLITISIIQLRLRMKALLFSTLVRNFEFELGDPKEELMVFKSVQGGIDASHILEL